MYNIHHMHNMMYLTETFYTLESSKQFFIYACVCMLTKVKQVVNYSLTTVEQNNKKKEKLPIHIQ